MIHVMIADDQELIRESLGIVLGQNEDMEVTGLAKDGQELLALVEKHVPDVILMDIRMPVIDGVQATRAVKERHPEVKVIVLTTFDDDEYVYGALKYGASGYLLKGVSMQDLAAAIRKVTTGGTVRNGLSSALSKLGLRDRTQLALWAVQTGLVQKGVES